MSDISQSIKKYIKSTKNERIKGLFLSDFKAYLSDIYSCFILDYTGTEKWLKMAQNGSNNYPFNRFDTFMVILKASKVDLMKYRDIVRQPQKVAINGVNYDRKYLLYTYDFLGDNIAVYQEEKAPRLLKIYSDRGFGVIAPFKD